MVEWLRRRSLKVMKCTVHDLGIMGSNLSQIELGELGESVTEPTKHMASSKL